MRSNLKHVSRVTLHVIRHTNHVTPTHVSLMRWASTSNAADGCGERGCGGLENGRGVSGEVPVMYHLELRLSIYVLVRAAVKQ